MRSPIIGRPVSDQAWESIRAEFTLPSLGQVRRRLAELMEDTDPVMRQLFRAVKGLSALGGLPDPLRFDPSGTVTGC